MEKKDDWTRITWEEKEIKYLHEGKRVRRRSGK